MTDFFLLNTSFSRRFESFVEAIFLGATLVASLLTNLSLAIPLLGAKTRSVTNHYELNLALADVLFALGVPAVLAVRLEPKWLLGMLSAERFHILK